MEFLTERCDLMLSDTREIFIRNCGIDLIACKYTQYLIMNIKGYSII